MSVDYNVYLRAKPDLAAFEEEYGLEMDGDDYIFGGFRLWVHEYEASDDDPLADHPWQSQITWVLAANGRHHDDTYDDFVSFLEAVADRYNGGVWCDHWDDNEVEWHGWDRDGLDKRAHAWTADEVVAWFEAQGEAEIHGACAQVAEIIVGRLKSFEPRDRGRVILAMSSDDRRYNSDLEEVLGDALLEVDPAGNKDVANAQRALRDERAKTAADDAPLPATSEEVGELFDRAARDPYARRVLDRAIDSYTGNDFVRDEVGVRLLEVARAGGKRPGWVHSVSAFRPLWNAPERRDRDAFQRLGPLAAELVREWNDADAYAAKTSDLIERRRRGGEIFAGIPDDIRAMARANRTKAVAEYARRYGLSLDKAKQVVDANA